MNTYDEWYYAELLEMLKHEDKHDVQYKQLELPLPEEYVPEIKKEEQQEVERGVIIIDM
jgi:hypothetical protein